jgi:DNA-binding GntR family transcriptional regulator
VREALRRLESSGLVETRPRRGTVVARPEPGRLREIFAVMAELEALCVAAAARAMPPAARRNREALHGRMGAMVRAGELGAYRDANVTFHQALYAGAQNGYLAELAQDARRRVAGGDLHAGSRNCRLVPGVRRPDVAWVGDSRLRRVRAYVDRRPRTLAATATQRSKTSRLSKGRSVPPSGSNTG